MHPRLASTNAGRVLHAAVLCALLLGNEPPIVATQDNATDYPQWRGRTRDGSASAFVAPARWPETLTRRWAVDVGEGYATPLVVGEIVYTFTRQDGNEVATAFDTATGEVVWKTAYPAPYEMFSGTARDSAKIDPEKQLSKRNRACFD